jgi:hypothetical protein
VKTLAAGARAVALQVRLVGFTKVYAQTFGLDPAVAVRELRAAAARLNQADVTVLKSCDEGLS